MKRRVGEGGHCSSSPAALQSFSEARCTLAPGRPCAPPTAAASWPPCLCSWPRSTGVWPGWPRLPGEATRSVLDVSSARSKPSVQIKCVKCSATTTHWHAPGNFKWLISDQLELSNLFGLLNDCLQKYLHLHFKHK